MDWDINKAQFKNWKSRCSSVGHLCTNPTKITKKQKEQIATLSSEKKTGLNVSGRKVTWTDTKAKTLKTLIDQRDGPEELTTGMKTHLDNVFRSEFWGRKRLNFNKYMDKGNANEDDSLGLLSKVDGDHFFDKNDIQYENDYLTGTPDAIFPHVVDVKTKWDMDTFDVGEMTSIYQWQVKAYIWMMLNNKRLTTWKGELVYCLVNGTFTQMQNEKTGLFYKLGSPDDDVERFVQAKLQLERNMIFDYAAWKKSYPLYQLEHERVGDAMWRLTVPAKRRVKRMPVVLNTRDINLMSRRVKMARKYLMAKEKAEYLKIGDEL